MSAYRTLRRIQVIVALMMILSMVAGSPIVQAQTTGSIAAFKFLDANQNGAWESSEEPIENWQLCIGADCQNTNSGGFATWGGLAYGNYTVSETLPTGWTNTTPTSLSYGLTKGSSTWGALGPANTTIAVGSSTYSFEFVTHTGNTWTYRATELSGQDLSHWVLGLGTCINRIASGTTTPYQAGSDGSTGGFTGIKWNIESFGGDSFTTGTFTIVLDGNYPEGTVEILAKTGSGDASSTIRGPICAIFGNYPNTYSLSGYKWLDADGDGVWDGSEDGLAGWTIQLKNAAGTVIATDVTDANGAYSFSDLVPGTYTVAEVLQAGYEQTFPAGDGTHSVTISNANVTGVNFGNWEPEDPTYGISGQKWNDLDADGVKDGGEDGLDGWTIRLWQNGSVISTTVTSYGGYYSFSNLPAGTYSVTEVLQSGWQQTFPVGGSHEVSLPEDETGDGIAGGVDFGNNEEPELGTITVVKVADPSDGTDFAFEFQDVPFALEDGDSRTFYDLSAGTYNITETVPAGWSLTNVNCVESDPPPARLTALSSFQWIGSSAIVNLGEGEHVVCTFTNVKDPDPTYGISGSKWNDEDGDGAWDGDEDGLSGWTINLWQNGSIIDTATTITDGSYSFSDLPAGVYSVTEELQFGWEQTYPIGGSHEVTLPAKGEMGWATDVDFGNRVPDVPTYSLSGSKWNDLNENGAWDGDPKEPVLEDWTIQLWQNGAVVATTTTAADGTYSFSNLPAGTYSVTEVLQTGWTQTYPAGGAHEVTLPDSQDGSASGLDFGNYRNIVVVTYGLSGYKWNDADGDGLWDAGETGLAGWEITLTRGDLVLTTTTAADGSYSFDNLEPGTYTVAETQQSGWTQTFPAGGTHSVTISDADVVDVNFGNRVPEVPTYSISGIKWEDSDGDGTRDAGEPTLSGWTIQLRNAAGDLIATTVTGAGGAYSFTGLQAGSYTVSEVQQSGWVQTYPKNPNTHPVTIDDADVGNVNFGNREPEVPTYSISGIKWEDKDGDGTRDADEGLLAGWTIQLRDEAGGVIATAVTDASGAYAFTGLLAGTYTVSEVQKDGWTQTFPAGDGSQQVTLGPSATGVDFGNQFTYEAATYSISGFKWNDGNKNGAWDGGEPGIGGWTIRLLDAEGGPIASTTTDASGAYRFDNLEAGSYIVAEVQQSGWEQTFPSSGGTHAVVLVEASVTGVNFGNYRPIEQPPTPEPCIRSDVSVVLFGGWNDIPVKAWVGGTEQQTLHTAVDAFGQQQVMWTFYPPANTTWNVSVQPQLPAGLDPARWQYKLVRIASPSQGTENNAPGSPSVSITRCNQYVLYFQLMDNGVTPPVAPTPPSDPQLPVTGGGPEPIVAGGLGLFAALSGLGWSIRRRR